ncbi:MAG: DUF935 family protein [Verrucomicrobia bacterium]|nr:DUF935 family protein [Verrucomicrobiota bacterium]
MSREKKFSHRVETAKIVPRRLPRGTILNRQGQPVQALVAPAGGSSYLDRLNRINAGREYLNPLRGLTIARAIALLEEYQLGRMADLQWTWFFAEQTDPDMIALLALRVAGLVEMDYNLSPEEDSDDKLAEEQTAFLAEKLAKIDNLYEAIEHLAMAPFRGFAHVEKHTDAAGEIVHLEPVDQWNVVRDGMRGPWKYNPTARSIDYLSMTSVEDLPMERFLYRECRRPINRFALLKFVRNGLTEKDWDAFNEIFNVPGGVVIGPPEVPEGDEEIYEAAARKVAEGGSGYLPHGSEYVPNEMPHDPQTFKLRLDFLSEKLVLAGTGGKLTMLTAAGSGTLAGSAHAQVFASIRSAEAMRISEIVTKGMISGWLDEGFPGKPHVVYFGLAANEETDSAAAVEQVAKLSLAGFQCDPEQVTQKTGWKVTVKPQPVAGLLDNPDAPARSPIANRASDSIAAGNEARFMSESERMLAEADLAVLAPVIDRVRPIRQELVRIDGLDDAGFAAGMAALQPSLRRLQTDLPELEKQVLTARPDLEEAFTDIVGTAFLSGAAEASDARAKMLARKARNRAGGHQRANRGRSGRQRRN